MIDLTPLDVRKKRGDFRKMLRGYDPQEVDTFLELAAERLEALVKENMALAERSGLLGEQVKSSESREKAIQEALVSAQTLRQEISQQASREAEAIREQSKREASMLTEQARAEARQLREQVEAEVLQIRQQAVGDTERLKAKTESELERLTVELEHVIGDKTGAIDELERKRTRFLRAFRSLLERELDAVAIEEGKVASDDAILELDLTGGQRRVQARMIETAALGLLAEGDARELDAANALDEVTAESADVAADVAVTSESEEDLAARAAAEESATEAPEASPTGDAPSRAASDAEPPESVSSETEAEPAVDVVLDVASVADLAPEGESLVPASMDEPEEDLSLNTLADDATLAADPTHADADALADLDPEGLDSLVDRVLADEKDLVSTPALASVDEDHAEDDGADEGIPIGSLAPEDGAPSLDEDARAAVNQLFDREDVTIASENESQTDAEDAWTKVLRGDESRVEAKDSGNTDASSDGGEESRGSWAPNFPDKGKGRTENSSGWSRARDRDGSRWR